MFKKVSFQGVEGAYSHLAVQEFFPNAEAVPCKTFELAITAAESGDVDYAMIPIENSAKFVIFQYFSSNFAPILMKTSRNFAANSRQYSKLVKFLNF